MIGTGLLNNLISYWDFNLSPNDNQDRLDGLVTGATSGQTGILNDCYYYDGIDDYINYGDVTNFDGLTGMSFSFWIYTDGQIDPQVGVLFSKYKATVTTPADRVFLIDINSSNIMRFSVYDENGRNDYGRDIQTTDNAITPSQWNHIVITWYGPNHIIKFYVNNKLVPSTLTQNAGGTTQIYDRPTKLYFGAAELGSTSPDYFYKGKLDEVGIWGNRILSVEDINTLNNEGNGLSYDTFSYDYSRDYVVGTGLMDDLQSYWSFDDPSFVNDINRHIDGQITGATFQSGQGIINDCYYYDGIDDYINFGNNDAFSFTDGVNDIPFSVSCWIKPSEIGTNCIWSKMHTSITIWNYICLINQNDIFVQLYGGGGAIQLRAVSSNEINTTDVWYHIGFSYDGSKLPTGMKIYINGGEVVYSVRLNNNDYDGMPISTSPFKIGTAQLPGGTYDYPFKGNIDELGVWKNKILSVDDFKTLYNNGDGLSYNNYRY
jgi:Concanavalin A-like lectin/glucanases superfamily